MSITRSHEWAPQDAVLPTAPGAATGIVAWTPRSEDHRARVTVQCSACLRTLTDDILWAVKACDFAPDEGQPGHLKYRRCRDCQEAKWHPEPPADPRESCGRGVCAKSDGHEGECEV